MRKIWTFKSKLILIIIFPINTVYAEVGFVNLPISPDTESAYVTCNSTGKYGLSNSTPPTIDSNNTCAVITQELNESPLNAPIADFRLIGILVSDVSMPRPHAGRNSVVAVLTDAIWRNKENTECILGTHLEMKDSPLSNNRYWEINDIVRGGFSGKDIAIAYFYKPHSQKYGGNTEVLFRAGRTFSSAVTSSENHTLPLNKDPLEKIQEVNEGNFAKYDDNWVNFTTDISFLDSDESTRAISSIFYIKYNCDSRDPIRRDNAIHLRSTGQNGENILAISTSGLVPADAKID